MNKLQKILGAVGLVATLEITGCREYRTEYSPILHENAVVDYKHYTPAKIKPKLGVTIIGESGEFGLGTGGWGYNIEGFTISPDYNPAKYEIAFDGKIRFKLNDEKIFNRFNSNDKANVSYRERYMLTYDDTNKDGTNELIERKLIKYDFLDAQPITNK